MARISLVPQNRAFFELYGRAAANVVAISRKLVDLLGRFPDGSDEMFRDIRDLEDEAAGNIVSYGVREVRPRAREQADVIVRAAAKLEEAVAALDGFKDATRTLIELRELEDEGDRLVREGVAELFAAEEQPLAVIRWKDIYEHLEETV